MLKQWDESYLASRGDSCGDGQLKSFAKLGTVARAKSSIVDEGRPKEINQYRTNGGASV